MKKAEFALAVQLKIYVLLENSLNKPLLARVRGLLSRGALRLINRISGSAVRYIDGDERIDSYLITDINQKEIMAVAKRIGVTPISQNRRALKFEALVSLSDADKLIDNLKEFTSYGFTILLKLSAGERLYNARLASNVQLFFLRLLFGSMKIVSLTIFKPTMSNRPSRVFGPEYGVVLIPVSKRGKWWASPHSDRLAPPFHESYIAHLGEATSLEPEFPVDLVYTWVDGSDPAWIERKSAAMNPAEKLRSHATDRNRFENRNELLYSLRSAIMYAPWARNIYIITDQQKPDWLDNKLDQRIRIVDHSNLFPDNAHLPCFNSHAIESVMHRIEGLSDRFIYLNDDMLFNSPTTPGDFFSAGGQTKVFLSLSGMPLGIAKDRKIGSEWGGMNASKMLFERFGRIIDRKIKHTPVGISRKAMFELEKEFEEEFTDLRKTPFRSHTDFAPVVLYLHFGLFRGHAILADITYDYIGLGDPNSPARLKKLLGKPRKVICINDEDMKSGSLAWEKRTKIARDFFEFQYPWKAPWEETPANIGSGKTD